MVLNYKDIAMGTNSNEEITNSLENDIFSERVSLDQNTRKSKFNQEILQYPLNAGNDGGRTPAGHHIQFEILEQDVGLIKFGELKTQAGEEVVGLSELIKDSSGMDRQVLVTKDGSVFTVIPEMNAKGEILSDATNVSRGAQKLGLNPFITGRAELRNIQQQSVRIRNQTFSRAPVSRLKSLIKLFMPPTVEVTYAPQYSEEGVGIFADTAVGAVDKFIRERQGGASVGRATAESIKEVIKESGVIQKSAISAAEGIAPGFKAIIFARSGKAVNNRIELIFSGLAKRSFSFNFKFLPKSYQEAKAVYNIVRRFKFHMLPEIAGDVTTSRTFITPDVFDIKYMMSDGKENEYINKISTCVLENMNVKYGGDRYQAFDPSMAEAGAPDGLKAPPVQTEMTLQFKELELVTQNNVLARGF